MCATEHGESPASESSTPTAEELIAAAPANRILDAAVACHDVDTNRPPKQINEQCMDASGPATGMGKSLEDPLQRAKSLASGPSVRPDSVLQEAVAAGPFHDFDMVPGPDSADLHGSGIILNGIMDESSYVYTGPAANITMYNQPIVSIQEDTCRSIINRIQKTFEDGNLLVKTIPHDTARVTLPTGRQSTTLVLPGSKQYLYGNSTQRVALLYDVQECAGGIVVCGKMDLHATYTTTGTEAKDITQKPTCSLAELQQHLSAMAASGVKQLYNEVNLEVGQPLGVALCMPFLDEAQEADAKKTALHVHRLIADMYKQSTIVVYDEGAATIVCRQAD